MIQFPETAIREWTIVADAASAHVQVRQRIERGTAVANAVERLRINHEARITHQQELDAETTPAVEIVSLSNYSVGSVSDLIDGVMKENGLTLMLGPSGSGKSTVALQMLHSLATGVDWLGQPVKQIAGAVGVVSYDMDAGLLLDWMSGFPNLDADKVSVVNAHKRGNPLGVPSMRSQIASVWRNLKVETILIDSFSASFFAQDQNDAATTMAHYRDLMLFALTEVGAKSLVVIVHSTDSNPHKARGSSVHHDVADSIVSLEVHPQTKQRSLRMTKYRAALGQKQMGEIMITAPDSVTHLVSLDTGAMALAGMHITNAGAAAFLPQTHEEPDIETDEEDEL